MPTSQTSYVPADDPCPTCKVIYPEPHRQGCPEHKEVKIHQVEEARPAFQSIGEAPPVIVRNDRMKVMEAMAELSRRDREREELEKNPPPRHEPPAPTLPPVVQPEPPLPPYPSSKGKPA